MGGDLSIETGQRGETGRDEIREEGVPKVSWTTKEGCTVDDMVRS